VLNPTNRARVHPTCSAFGSASRGRPVPEGAGPPSPLRQRPPLRRSTVQRVLPPTRRIGPTSARHCQCRTCSAFVVSHHLDGFRHCSATGLLHPAHDHGVHRVSGRPDVCPRHDDPSSPMPHPPEPIPLQQPPGMTVRAPSPFLVSEETPRPRGLAPLKSPSPQPPRCRGGRARDSPGLPVLEHAAARCRMGPLVDRELLAEAIGIAQRPARSRTHRSGSISHPKLLRCGDANGRSRGRFASVPAAPTCQRRSADMTC
jgi:hypothetical protein